MDEFQAIQQWLNSKETQLKKMEANPLMEIGEVLQRIKKLQVIAMQYICSLTASSQANRSQPSFGVW